MKMNIPNTVKQWCQAHIAKMIETARQNRSGVCSWKNGNSIAIYVHTAAVPAANVPDERYAGQDRVHIEWTSNAGYSDDPMSFSAALLHPSDSSTVNTVSLGFEAAIQLVSQ